MVMVLPQFVAICRWRALDSSPLSLTCENVKKNEYVSIKEHTRRSEIYPGQAQTHKPFFNYNLIIYTMAGKLAGWK